MSKKQYSASSAKLLAVCLYLYTVFVEIEIYSEKKSYMKIIMHTEKKINSLSLRDRQRAIA